MDESFYHISEKAVERVAEMAALTVPGVHHLLSLIHISEPTRRS